MSIIDLQKKTIIVTGAAGFIGASLVKRILSGILCARIIGIDNMNPYYNVALKEFRLKELLIYPQFTFIKGDITDKAFVMSVFQTYSPDIVVNLAAQAGVRHSITNPDDYIESNIIGFYHILEACRHSYDNGGNGIEHLVYASSSSVYGANRKIPYSTADKTDTPVSLYAATKKSDELLAYAYSELYGIPCTGLRFFTVYGPAGRPDMAYFQFAEKLRAGQKICLFNYGDCQRDFTYIDDIVEGMIRVIGYAPDKKEREDGTSDPPYAIYNIGNSHPETLINFVDTLQKELVRAGVLPNNYDFEGHRELVSMQPGDVTVTYADVSDLEHDFGYRPSTRLADGLRKFAEWYAAFLKDPGGHFIK